MYIQLLDISGLSRAPAFMWTIYDDVVVTLLQTLTHKLASIQTHTYTQAATKWLVRAPLLHACDWPAFQPGTVERIVYF